MGARGCFMFVLLFINNTKKRKRKNNNKKGKSKIYLYICSTSCTLYNIHTYTKPQGEKKLKKE